MRNVWSGRSALYVALCDAIKASAVSPQPEPPSKRDSSPHGETTRLGDSAIASDLDELP